MDWNLQAQYKWCIIILPSELLYGSYRFQWNLDERSSWGIAMPFIYFHLEFRDKEHLPKKKLRDHQVDNTLFLLMKDV